MLSTFILIGFNPDIRPDRSNIPCPCQLHLMGPLLWDTACLLPVHPPPQRVRTHSFPWAHSNTKGGEILLQPALLPTPSSLPLLSLCCKTNWKGDVGITITGREFVTAWPQSYGAPRREGKGSCRKRCRNQDPALAGSGPLRAIGLGRRKCILLSTILKSNCTVRAAGCLHLQKISRFALREAHRAWLCTAAQLPACSAAFEHHTRNSNIALTPVGKNFSTSSQRRTTSLDLKIPPNSGNKLVH